MISREEAVEYFVYCACSECDHRILRAKCNYCPNCGADMAELPNCGAEMER